ncbi:MAG: C10 family peptidase [Bacteroidales bacterium]|nr:C10 family peptidase [Candidatus Cryptobacteroides equifaecalis]
MKRFITSALLLLLTLLASAGVVDRKEAQRIAGSFFGGGAALSQGKELVLEKEGFGSGRFKIFSSNQAVRMASSVMAPQPSYFIFNRPGGGWVIVAGEDSVTPILAYSDMGAFDSSLMPDNLQWWLDMLDAGIQVDRANSAASLPRTSGVRMGQAVVSLTTASWDQGAPYYNECPMKGGRRCVTGCVATAAAIVFRYFKWPESGEGTIPSYSYDGLTVPGTTLGRKYDYENMPLSYHGNYTSTQAAAVAALMYDIGRSVKMMYSPDASGAYTRDLLNACRNYFFYNPGAYLGFRSSYSDSRWISMLKDQLDRNIPVIYGGDDGEGGHQFVFDGYDNADMFHVNWGWGGAGNGYFAITKLGGSQIGYVFNYNQDALFDLYPEGGSFSNNIFLSYDTSKPEYRGIVLSTDDIVPGEEFTVTRMGSIVNTGKKKFTGSVSIALYDKKLNLKEVISKEIPVELEAKAKAVFDNIDCLIKGEVVDGDRIRVRYKDDSTEGYCQAEKEVTGFVTEIVLSGGISPQRIAANTSLSYDKASRKITLVCRYPVQCTITTSAGMILKRLSAEAAEPLVLDLADFSGSAFVISLSSGGGKSYQIKIEK